ncbi:MAG TPA: hypothetical protein VIV12_17165 [Streptosporangiaceae bacterium]
MFKLILIVIGLLCWLAGALHAQVKIGAGTPDWLQAGLFFVGCGVLLPIP